jgi:hypothetical protein
MSQSSSILSGICKYDYAMTNQVIVQKLPFPTTNKILEDCDMASDSRKLNSIYPVSISISKYVLLTL